jgi:hypothetical protein
MNTLKKLEELTQFYREDYERHREIPKPPKPKNKSAEIMSKKIEATLRMITTNTFAADLEDCGGDVQALLKFYREDEERLRLKKLARPVIPKDPMIETILRMITTETLADKTFDSGIKEGTKRDAAIKVIKQFCGNMNSNEDFINSLNKNKRLGDLDLHSLQEYFYEYYGTFKFREYDIGFAMNKKDGTSVSVFNNTEFAGLTLYLLEAAISGPCVRTDKKLEHFNCVLPPVYEEAGFVEIGREKWDERYKPANWDDADGTPYIIRKEYQKTRRTLPLDDCIAFVH